MDLNPTTPIVASASLQIQHNYLIKADCQREKKADPTMCSVQEAQRQGKGKRRETQQAEAPPQERRAAAGAAWCAFCVICFLLTAAHAECRRDLVWERGGWHGRIIPAGILQAGVEHTPLWMRQVSRGGRGTWHMEGAARTLLQHVPTRWSCWVLPLHHSSHASPRVPR